MTDNGCWTSEYDWEVKCDWKPENDREVELDSQEVSLDLETESRETVLCVLFDDGAQRQFSSVRITLLCSDDVTPEHHEAWVRRSPLQCSFRLIDRSSRPLSELHPICPHFPSSTVFLPSPRTRP